VLCLIKGLDFDPRFRLKLDKRDAHAVGIEHDFCSLWKEHVYLRMERETCQVGSLNFSLLIKLRSELLIQFCLCFILRLQLTRLTGHSITMGICVFFITILKCVLTIKASVSRRDCLLMLCFVVPF
jgi:hypothetical protein